MTDYKRMVSYMYQYENGIKRKNVGYVRVEVKNGQCKFTIHMQLLGQTDSIFPTYLLHRDSKGLDLIYLGDSLLKAHLIDNRFIAEEANIMGSGYSLKDMSGVLIFMNNNIFFATVWDNYALKADELLEAMKPKKRNNEEKKPEGKDHEAREPGVKEAVGGVAEDGQKDIAAKAGMPDQGRADADRVANVIYSDGKAADGKVANGKVADGIIADSKAAGGKVADGKTAEDKVADDKIIKGKISEGNFAVENAGDEEKAKDMDIEKATEQDKEKRNMAPEEMKQKGPDADDIEYGEEKLSLEEELKISTYRFPRGLKTVEMFRRSKAVADKVYCSGNEEAEFQENAEEPARTVARVGQEGTAVGDNVVAAEDASAAEDAAAEAEKKYEKYYDNEANRAAAAEAALEAKPFGSRMADPADSGLSLSQADSEWSDKEAVGATYQKQAEGERPDLTMPGGRTQTQIGGRKEAQPYVRRIDGQTDSSKSEAQAYGSRTEAQPYSGSTVSPDGRKTMDLDGIMSHFNRLYPFEDNEMLICVKIEPKDIGLLPKEYWHLSSNSFLLHGYYCYRHLLLAKMKYKDRPVYILGVPGLYQQREQFMARMFGFDSFKSIKKREPKKGDFGYWYLQLDC